VLKRQKPLSSGAKSGSFLSKKWSKKWPKMRSKNAVPKKQCKKRCLFFAQMHKNLAKKAVQKSGGVCCVFAPLKALFCSKMRKKCANAQKKCVKISFLAAAAAR
jgi:hypothetical protein